MSRVYLQLILPGFPLNHNSCLAESLGTKLWKSQLVRATLEVHTCIGWRELLRVYCDHSNSICLHSLYSTTHAEIVMVRNKIHGVISTV